MHITPRSAVRIALQQLFIRWLLLRGFRYKSISHQYILQCDGRDGNVDHSIYVYCGCHKVINTCTMLDHIIQWIRQLSNVDAIVRTSTHSCQSNSFVTHTENDFRNRSHRSGKLMSPARRTIGGRRNISIHLQLFWWIIYLAMSNRTLIEHARIELRNNYFQS